MPAHRNVVCLVVDRLHSGFLGPYGNTWIATPEMDRLAAESFVFDRAYIDSPGLEDLYRSLWQGRHALHPNRALQSADAIDLPHRLIEAGYNFDVLSDDSLVARLANTQCFELAAVGNDLGERAAEAIEETELASFFGVAGGTLGELEPPFFLWLHTGSLGRNWDAPLDSRNQYADSDDPPPPETVIVPERRLPTDFDPDELLGVMHSYAGQVSLLDTCIGSLIEALADTPFAGQTLFVLISARGFPLGEHGRIGVCDEALYGELAQIPLMLRFPDGMGQSDRTQALVQPADLHATLAEWCELPDFGTRHYASGRSLLPLAAGAVDSIRDRVAVAGPGGQRVLVTPAWYLRMTSEQGETGPVESSSSGDAGDASCELFVKPDDRFEVNDVADRCPESVAELKEAFVQFEQCCESPDFVEPPPLGEILMRGLE